MLKNLKYYAGLFDADGSFDIDASIKADGSYYINARATLYQKDIRPLIELANEFDVEVKKYDVVHSVNLRGAKARMFIEQVKRHLVIKGAVAQFVLDNAKTKVANKEELKALRKEVKAKRAERTPEKPFPSRKWMAGYVDGDGCLLSSYRKKDGVLEFKLTVTSHVTQMQGLELMHKVFGGYITSQNDVRQWHVTLSVSRGTRVLSYFHKHLVMKGDQANLILGCLSSKRHIRRCGATQEGNLEIHRNLQAMKSPATTESKAP
mgnify:CR=1 FL=1